MSYKIHDILHGTYLLDDSGNSVKRFASPGSARLFLKKFAKTHRRHVTEFEVRKIDPESTQ